MINYFNFDYNYNELKLNANTKLILARTLAMERNKYVLKSILIGVRQAFINDKPEIITQSHYMILKAANIETIIPNEKDSVTNEELSILMDGLQNNIFRVGFWILLDKELLKLQKYSKTCKLMLAREVEYPLDRKR